MEDQENNFWIKKVMKSGTKMCPESIVQLCWLVQLHRSTLALRVYVTHGCRQMQ